MQPYDGRGGGGSELSSKKKLSLKKKTMFNSDLMPYVLNFYFYNFFLVYNQVVNIVLQSDAMLWVVYGQTQHFI